MALGVDDLLLLGGTMAAIGGGIGMGNMFTTAKTSYKYNKRLLDQQQRWQRKMMQNAHQWEVQDLRDAGLNPILSAGGSPGSYSASSAGSVHVPDPSGGLGDAMNLFSTAIGLDKGLSEVEVIDNQAKKLAQDYQNDALLTQNTINKTMADIDALKDMTFADVALKQSQVQLNSALSSKALQEALRVSQETDFYGNKKVQQQRYNKMLYDVSGRIGKEFGLFGELTRDDTPGSPLSAFPQSALDVSKKDSVSYWDIFQKELRKNYGNLFKGLVKQFK